MREWAIFEFFVIAGLIVAVFRLFGRIKTLDAALIELREETAHRFSALEEGSAKTPAPASPSAAEERSLPDDTPEPEPVPAPPAVEAAEPVARRPVTVPLVTAARGDVSLAAHGDATVGGQPVPPPSPAKPRFSLSSLDFEEIFGRRLPIWAGGIALAVAGVFLVRYSIEAGLLTPAVRVIMAFLFGLALLGGAEFAYRFEDRVADPRVRQALAGAGLATLYAAVYLAGTQYGLIGQTLAFVGLAAVTAAAIALSYRFGLPSAVLGLVGGFAAPALVGGDEANLPLLSLYLGLVTTGLTLTGQRQQRSWLGIAALVGGLGWGALLLLTSDMGVAGLLALGLYIVALGVVLPAFVGSQLHERPVRLAAALAASAQLALLVHQGGYAPLAWGLYLLLAAALAWFGWRRPDLREANMAAAVIGVLLYAQWASAPPVLFTAVGTALAAVFAGVPLALIAAHRQRRIDLGQLALVGPALAAVAYGTFGDPFVDRVETPLALATLALAALPLAGAWLLRQSEDSHWFAGLIGSGVALVYAALLMITPGWSAPLAAAAVLAGPVWLACKRADAALTNLLWAGGGVTMAALAVTPYFLEECGRLSGDGSIAPVLPAVLRWLATALPFAALAWVEARRIRRHLAEGLAAALFYGTIAQVIPGDWLAWAAALAALAVARWQPARFAAQITLAGIALLWALEPVAMWLMANIETLFAEPAHIGDLPTLKQLALRILPSLACATMLPLPAIKGRGISRAWLVAPLALVAVHSLYKQVFAIETNTAFIAYGMAERTLWEALLLAAAWIADRGVPFLGQSRRLAIGLAAAALAHFLVYTAGLHNPLWSVQAVGPTPLANWILAAWTVAVGAALLLRQWLTLRWRPAVDGLIMAIVSLGAIALLRQVFAGSIPSAAPLGQTEDLLRSLVGILLALVFLWIGSRNGERSWRIGSLVLMLIAVAKVFLFDAAQLEGLLRIASFMALGFSLIGIGWIYSRQLRRDAPAAG